MKITLSAIILSLLFAFAAVSQAHEQTFTANLSGDAQPTPVVTSANGTAVLTLNATHSQLDYFISLSGVDLGGQTAPTDDDVVGTHFHNAPAGANGPIVFGILGSALLGAPFDPNATDDADDRVIDPVAGTIAGSWDVADAPNLADFLAALGAGELYINVHTPRVMSGEIRGQIVPEPATWIAALIAMATVFAFRRAGAKGIAAVRNN